MKLGLVGLLLLILVLFAMLAYTTEGFANPTKRVSRIRQAQITSLKKKK